MSEWADVKLVITEKAMRILPDGTRYCGLEPPGVDDPEAGVVFSLSASELEATGARPDLWVSAGSVAVFSEPEEAPKRAKRRTRVKGKADDEAPAETPTED